ncbi:MULTISPECIES: tripartite tricarboxylate transporter TctB family protein [unclassified Halomonas]|uniref:tripartite tricarboxylate transporter TctB family protein n=1 Tax=unclassified Halomonas TaxID=2609666 RepID=UPI001CF20A6A|nr:MULTISPECIES: tripartite tricarboxylate transporter TctB family protein [unclassified Halomonas]MCA8863874.1 tripartite tricarboxylate transporter TctB family protein [Halomonas sp. SBBP1]UZH11119.1 tripartite tricarboxylate transporter TctB family protein [Halomonas sp. BDJS001]
MLTLTKDRALALALLLIVAVMWMESGDIRPPTSWQPYGSALFPRILLVVIGVLSLLILVRSLWVNVPERLGAKQLVTEWFQSRRTILALFLLFGLYAALLPVVGYIAATIGFLVASLALLLGIDTRRKWMINLTLSATLTIVIFVVFRYGLNVWLP